MISCHGLEACAAAARDILTAKGVRTMAEKRLSNGLQASLSFNDAACRMNYYWSPGKGFSAVPAGGDRDLLEMALSLLRGTPAPGLISGLRIGTDEAGKGDWFGPLVAAGAAGDDSVAQRLASLGVRDSKTLCDSRVLDLYRDMSLLQGLTLSVRVVAPREYNTLFKEYSLKGMNSLDIQAMAHGEVIGDLLHTVPARTVVVDRFCSEERISPWLPAGDYRLVLRCRAEDDPLVAAASVAARAIYLMELKRLSAGLPEKLVSGSGSPADSVGRNLVKSRGSAVLFDVAKVHFCNYSRAVTP
jgi:ribonuclease HIII